jgi:hypothetical protein
MDSRYRNRYDSHCSLDSIYQPNTVVVAQNAKWLDL